MQTRFNYTSGGEFLTKNNESYVGYFNVDDLENIYEGRYYTESANSLVAVSRYSADYYKFNNYKDRYVFDDIYMPHNLDEISIQPNELVNFITLNKKIEYFINNLEYLYSRMFMGSTDVPVDGNVNTLCNLIGTESFGWETRPNNRAFGFGVLSAVSSLSGFREYDNMKRMAVIPFKDSSGVSIFGISDTYLMGLTSKITEDGQLYGAGFTFYSDLIDNNTNETCKNLEDITYNGKYLYISDSKINGGGQVFKYDITQYYSGDSVFDGKRFLIEPIGGLGTEDNKNKFNGCTVLGSKLNEVWIYDAGNNVIKIFDDNFIWIRTIKIPAIRKYSVMDIRHRVMNNYTYVLFRDDYVLNFPQYGLFVYNENYTLIKTHVFEDILFPDTDGQFNRMAISEQDSNVFYVITNNSVFKKFFSKPEKTFAVFNREKFYPDDLFIWGDEFIERNWDELTDYETWNYAEFFVITLVTKDIYISPSNQNKDNVFFMGDSYISHLNEQTEYITVLQDENMPFYNYNSIKFENIEYNQALVLNKEFFKLYQNIIQFKNNLKGRFYAEYNKFSDITYKDYTYLTDEEINTLEIDLDYNSFINENELVQPNSINRIFKKIYDLQMKLLSLTNVKLKNFKTYVDIKNGSNIYPID